MLEIFVQGMEISCPFLAKKVNLQITLKKAEQIRNSPMAVDFKY